MFNCSWFVCIAVLQKHSALPSPQGYSARVRKRSEKRKEGSKAPTHSLRGCRCCCACSRQDKLLQQQRDPACLERIPCTQTNCSVLPGHTDKCRGFAEPCNSKDSIAPLSCSSCCSRAAVLHVHVHIIPLHSSHSQLPH